DDLVDDLDALALFVGLDADDDVAVLAFATGLADKLALALGAAVNGLAIGDLRLADGGLDLEFALHAINDDLKMKLAHAGQDSLAGVFVGLDLQGGALGDKTLKCVAHLLLVSLGIGLDRHRDNRLRERGWLEADVIVFVAKRIAGDDILDSDKSANVTGIGDIDLFTIHGAHQHEAGNTLTATGPGVVKGHALVNLTGINAIKHQFAHKRVGPELEGKARELAVIIGRSMHLVAFAVLPHHGGQINGRRQVVADAIEQTLDAFFLEGRSGNDAGELHRDGCLADGKHQLGNGDLLATEIFLGEHVIEIGSRLDELLAPLLGLSRIIGGDLRGRRDEAQILFVGAENVGDVLNEIDETCEVLLFADRNKQRMGISPELLAHFPDSAKEVGSGAIHLVDERNARNVVFIGLPPDGLRLGLNARD